MPKQITSRIPIGTIPLSRAAIQLRISYQRIQRLVTVGVLEGGQLQDGTWYALQCDVDRYAREQGVEGVERQSLEGEIEQQRRSV